jgi:hypothetical protein
MVTMATKSPTVTMNHPHAAGGGGSIRTAACPPQSARADNSDRRVGPPRPDAAPRHAAPRRATRRRGRDVLGPCQGFWLRYSSPLA